MPQRSTPTSRLDDRRFPVRITVLIPEGGLGRAHAEMETWLRERCGAHYAFHPADRFPQSSHLYLDDPLTAAEFVRQFRATLRPVPADD